MYLNKQILKVYLGSLRLVLGTLLIWYIIVRMVKKLKQRK